MRRMRLPRSVKWSNLKTHKSRARVVITKQSNQMVDGLLTFYEIVGVDDPIERDKHELERLEFTYECARQRDPCDGHTMVKSIELAHRLIQEAAARRGADRIASSSKTRAEAIAELEQLLAVYKDPAVTDEMWLASRQRHAPTKAHKVGQPFPRLKQVR